MDIKFYCDQEDNNLKAVICEHATIFATEILSQLVLFNTLYRFDEAESDDDDFSKKISRKTLDISEGLLSNRPKVKYKTLHFAGKIIYQKKQIIVRIINDDALLLYAMLILDYSDDKVEYLKLTKEKEPEPVKEEPKKRGRKKKE